MKGQSRSKTQSAKQKDLEPQKRTDADQPLTTNHGLRIGDNQNSLKAGSRGPTLLEDFILREKINHFDHERIPERVVHARGAAAHGVFQMYESMAEYTAAKFLQDPSRETPVFVRFSTVARSRGSADTVRDVRGFAVKFYTEEGVFDLVGNNIPIFFIQDATKFPDLIHAVKPEPHNEIPQAASAHDTFWDFVWLTPESMHMIMWHLSDRAIPRSFATMEGFGVNTFVFVNDAGQRRFVKFHWKPMLGKHSLVWDEAQKLAGKDSDFHRRDLWEAIEKGNFAEWEFAVQLIEEKDEQSFDFDPLDATKVWPESLVPLHRVGKLTLNRNPDNFFAETEQVAFLPTNMVQGIDFSNDPLLQGRLFSYLDTQLSRLGSQNFPDLPINRSIAPVHNNQRDGHMRYTVNTGNVSYQPNSLAGGCPFQAGADMGAFVSFPERIDAQKVRERSESFRDHFSQARLFWRSQSPVEQEHIVLAFRFELGKVESLPVRERMVDLITHVDMDLATKVAAGIGVADPATTGGAESARQRLEQGWDQFGATSRSNFQTIDQPATAPELSMANTVEPTIKGRKVAFLVAKGVDTGHVTAMKAALSKGGAAVEIIAPMLGDLQSATGSPLAVDKSLITTASIMYDAVFVPGGDQSVSVLTQNGDAVHFISEAFKHCKPVAAAGAGINLLLAANIAGPPVNGKSSASDLQALDGVVIMGSGQNINDTATRFVEAMKQHRFFARANKELIPA
ncbi:MAG: catalase [Chloroflexota bacterium]